MPMKTWILTIVAWAILTGAVTVDLTVGFDPLKYRARDLVERTFPSHDEGEEDGGEDLHFGNPDDPWSTWEVYQDDSAWSRERDQRPAGHHASSLLFLIIAPLGVAITVFLNRRDIANWWRTRRDAKSRMTRNEWLWFGAIMAVTALPRLFHLGTWPVEEAEWTAVEHLPLLDLIFHGKETLTDPPLFPVIQHFVYAVTTNLAATRLPTAICSIALVFATFRAGRQIANPRVGTIAALIAALHPALIANAHVMRPYSLLAALLLLALPHVHRMALDGGRKRDAVALTVFGSLAIWTHYASLLFLLVYFIYMAWCRRHDLSGFGRLVLSGIGLTVLFIPLIPFFFSEFSDKQGAGFANEFVETLLAAVTGLPLGFGWIAVAFVIFGRIARHAPGRLIATTLNGVLALLIATSQIVWWEPTHMLALVPLFALAMAIAIDSLAGQRHPFITGAIATPFVAPIAVVAGLLFTLPTTSFTVWRAVLPMTWHVQSLRAFASAVPSAIAMDPARFSCGQMAVTPVDNLSGFQYYWGPVSMEDLGHEPIVENNFVPITLPFDDPNGPLAHVTPVGPRPEIAMTITPIERTWSWEKGQWMDLELMRQKYGCLWYVKTYQNCTQRTGRFYSQQDCDYLEEHCTAVTSMPDGELWFCDHGRNVGPND